MLVTTEQSLAHLEVRATAGVVPSVPSFARLTDSLAALRSVTVLFTGTLEPSAAAATIELHRHCRDRGPYLSADFVLDADADACAALGPRSTPLGTILELSRALRIKGVPVRWWVPTLQPLVYRLEAIFSLARDERVDAVLVPHSALTDRVTASDAELDAEERRFVADFISYRLLGEESQSLSPTRAAFYRSLNDWLAKARPLAEEQRERIAVLEVDGRGEWLLREEADPAVTPLCDLNQARAIGTAQQPTARQPVAPLDEVAGVFAEGARALAQWARTALTRAFRGARRPRPDPSLPCVLVIGAYGGDHIGDTAIAGGVLLRMHRRYLTQRAILVSQRPEHTSRLVAMLDIPVSVTVHEYRQSSVVELLKQVDGVVFAGGPLMDLPKQLVKHLYTVSLARRDGKPFIIEGIGAGPFIRRVSAWTARLLVLMSERVTVRTAADSRAPLVRGLRPQVDRDPAFDYLETRGPDLTRLADTDREWLDRLFRDTEGRIAIGVNLRPLRPDYTGGAPAAARAEYTRFVEARFEERLAEAMRRFQKTSPAPPSFIFFPMNAIQFGSSDLRSAYRIKRLVRGDVDFRIWEGDPSIDGVVALLRRVDVAITMRFHATIYALSQQRPVIGIDYRPGVRDKVAALLTDHGRAENCARIDEMRTDWMVERLTELTRTSAAPTGVPRPGGTAGSSLRLILRPAAM